MPKSEPRRLTFVGLLVLATVVGCGGGPQVAKGVIVKGKVLKGGAPIPGVRPEIGVGIIQISLVPVVQSPTAESGIALLKADGSFEIMGAGKGIPAGKYKVAIMQRDQVPGQASAVPDAFSEANTKLEVEVPAAKVGNSHDLGVIDIDKPATP